MNRIRLWFLLLLAAVFTFSACSLKRKTNGGGGGGGNGGKATVVLTMRAEWLNPPQGTNLLSLVAAINEVTLTPASGTPITLTLPSTFEVDFSRLQSDSVFLGTLTSVPAGMYSVTASLSAPVAYFCTQPNPGTPGCASGSIAKVTGGAATPTISAALGLVSNEQIGISLNFQLQDILTIGANQSLTAVNFAASNAMNITTLPPGASSLGTGQLDFIEDFYGVVTNVSTTAQTVTVRSASRGTITATANSSTVYPINSNCAAGQTFTNCVANSVGDTVSMDVALNADGSLSLLEFDPFFKNVDVIAGVVTSIPSSTTQFQMVVNDIVPASTGSLLGSPSSLLGTPVNITLVNPNPFTVDDRGLTIPTNTFAGSTSASGLIPGQTVAVALTSFTPASGSAFAAADSNSLDLQFTRVTGAVSTAGNTLQFSIQSLPSFFGLNTPAIVQLTSGSPPGTPSTNFDGANQTSSALTAGQTVSIRALYFGPSASAPFSAAKVRVP